MVNKSDIETFWTRGDIHSRIHKAMSEAGLNDRKLDIEDLFPIDQYHARGIAATVDLGKRMPISENQRIIDIGCGLGGPARYFAKKFKCLITGIRASRVIRSIRPLPPRGIITSTYSLMVIS